jgi:hypothetical protein
MAMILAISPRILRATSADRMMWGKNAAEL